MSDTTFELDENEVPTSYSSSTPAAATNRKAITAPGAGTGRRKEAVARVRLVPGTGRWVVNGKTLENYFPNNSNCLDLLFITLTLGYLPGAPVFAVF